MRKTYTELITIPTLEERFEYLNQGNAVGAETFGYDRYLNQRFYRTSEWQRVRRNVIARDEGCDMAHPDFPIYGKVLIHHINPITIEDLMERNPIIFDLNNLVCVSHHTHNAIHYGDSNLLIMPPVERRANDTSPWR